MADEPNVPTHRWYQRRYHIPLAKEDVSASTIYDSGIQKIDAYIASLTPGPTNTVAPVVSGTATVGQTLSTTNGTWTGVGTITYAYQWLDDGAAISGATSSTYTLTAGEEGGFISCRVTATDDNGSTAATSNSVGPVAASGFSPADLFTSGEAGAWYDIHPDYCFQDAARTTAAAVGDPVGGVTDRSGNGLHASQSVSADRPTLRQDGSGNYYLEFDGVGDALSLGTFARPDPFWSVYGIDIQSDTKGMFMYSGTNPFDNVFESGSASGVFSGVGALSVLAVDQTDVSPQRRNLLYTALTGGPKVFTSSYTGGASSTTWGFGGYPSLGFDMDGARLYGMVWRDQMTAQERSDLETWMAGVTGVTL